MSENVKQIVWCLFVALYVLSIVMTPFLVGRKRDPYTPATATGYAIISLFMLAGIWVLKP